MDFFGEAEAEQEKDSYNGQKEVSKPLHEPALWHQVAVSWVLLAQKVTRAYLSIVSESTNETVDPNEDQYKVRSSIDKEDEVSDDASLHKACNRSHDDLESGCSERDHEDKSESEADILICVIIVRIVLCVECVFIVVSKARFWIVIHAKGVEAKDDCPETTPYNWD